MTDDLTVMTLALRALTRHLDELVTACTDADGKPKAPTAKDIARARAAIPHHPDFRNSFPKKET